MQLPTMHNIILLLASSTTLISAHRMESLKGKAGNAKFFNRKGESWGVDAHSGCRGTKVPRLVQFCVDWDLGRCHFRGDWLLWAETTCTWRRAEEEDEVPADDGDAAVPVLVG
ncbi:hypothetical protein CkaCkLH20_09172 [Colletotrichum karsti]|uniref:Secreted protein n=1 Tax=Colletotrichum karsti TaxID=1095194 RepID=A0A9P6LEN6_9PEZI|nr:uncharacterized protein CkaCkLH20_09172 [Colletotrichum karsti]KAF9873359.1 hypothetical protein CkaCkLH20_09172 [Colletotrichum karsti]